MRSAAASRPGTLNSSAMTSAKKIARLTMLLRSVRDCAASASPLSCGNVGGSAMVAPPAILRILFAFR
jgi:hypothetical protein